MSQGRSPRWAAARLALLALIPGCVIPITTASGSADGGNEASAIAGDAAIPSGSWSNETGNLAGMASECGNLSFLSAKPDEDMLVAGVALHGLWGSRDGGQTWTALGSAADAGPSITNRTSSIVYDPTHTARYWESGSYHPAGVNVTSDDGASFSALGDILHCDLVSVDFTDANRQTLVAGGHEQAQTLYRSTDGGKSWAPIGASLPPGTNCVYPLVLDAQTHLAGCGGYGGGPTGIYRTSDGGGTWTLVSSLGGTYAPLVASDGSIYWSGPNGSGLARSTDQGQTWTAAVASTTTLGSFSPIALPDGRIASIGPPLGTQYVLVSADQGATWTPASGALPYSDVKGLAYSAQRKAFYIWRFTCDSPTGGDPVPADAIMSFSFDYQKG